MRSFVYDQPAARVIFGMGSLDRLPEEVQRLGAHRAIVLSTPEQRSDAEEASRRLGDMAAAIFAEAVMHVPIETARAARDVAKRLDADCYVGIGGGSTIGLGKAIALETGMPIVAVPTTFAGSEMTPIYGLTESGIQKTGRDRKVLPHALEFNRESAPEAMRIAAEALGARDAAQAVYDLAARLGAPLALKDVGMPADGLDRAARLATENQYYNPRTVEYAGVRQLLE